VAPVWYCWQALLWLAWFHEPDADGGRLRMRKEAEGLRVMRGVAVACCAGSTA
jgi:hypothetical protein